MAKKATKKIDETPAEAPEESAGASPDPVPAASVPAALETVKAEVKAAKKSAKKAAKKAAKKVVKKTALEKAASLPGSFVPKKGATFELLSEKGGEWTRKLTDSLHAIAQRRTNKPVSFKTASQMKQDMLPFPHFLLQFLTGAYGMQHGTHVDILGPTGVGKSSFVLTCVGFNLKRNCPTLIMHCEGKGKAISPGRMMRCFSTDPAEAARMLEVVTVTEVHSLAQMDRELQDWVKAVRDSGWPSHLPLQVVVDPISKLLNDTEAAGFFDYGKNMDAEHKKKFKETAQGSNMGHAKFYHAFSRRMAALSTTHNVNLWLIHHQNDEVDMSGGKSFGFPENPLTKSLKNTTAIGGRGTAQTAALRLVMVPYGEARGPDKKHRGNNVRVMVNKFSHGPSRRHIDFELREEHEAYDRQHYLDPALQFDGHFAKWLGENKFLGVKIDNDIYSSSELGLMGVGGEDLGAYVQSNELLRCRLGLMLKIDGYQQIVDDIQASAPTPVNATT